MAKNVQAIPQRFSDCTDEQKEMVSELSRRFSAMSGLTEPSSWATKIKTWYDPLVLVMNATGWTDAGMHRATRVTRQVVADFVRDRVEIPHVLKIYRRICNVLGNTQFSRSDFPELSYQEFVEKMRLEYKQDDDFSLEVLAHQADLYKRAMLTMDKLHGDSVEDKIAEFEKLMYGDDNE